MLFVSHTGLWGGGAEIVLGQMVRAVKETGWRSYVATRDGEIRERVAADCAGSAALPFPWFRRTLSPLTWFRFLREWIATVVQLVLLIRRWEIDIVHANSAVAALTATLPAFLLCRPLVWHQHDIVPDRVINRVVLGLCGRLASTVVATSGSVAHSLTQLGIPEGKVRIVYPRVREQFSQQLPDRTSARRTLGIPLDRFVVTVIGRLVPRKAQDVVLRALNPLICSGMDIHLLLGPDDASAHTPYRETLQALSQDPALAGRVTFLPFRDDVSTLLAATDLLVMPSYAEPFGIVILEAMAAGVPVVASSTGGPAEILEDEETGFLVPPGDIAAFSSAIGRLQSDAALRSRLTAQAPERVRTSFSEQTLGPDLDEVYRGLLRGGTRGKHSPDERAGATRV